MPRATVAWYDRDNEEAGYHVCSNCEIGKGIDGSDIRIGNVRDIRNDVSICPDCDRLRKRTTYGICRQLTIETS